VGSRVRIAAATCLMASGLLAGSATAAIAFADPVLTGDGSGDKHTNDSVGNGRDEKPTSDPDEKNTTPGAGGKAEDPKAEDGKKDEENDGDNNGIGGNPNNGNCGNSGSNGNAQGCGGANDPDDPPTTKPTRPPTPEEPPQPPDDPGGCEEENKDGCSPGGPWWPWPWPWNPGQPPALGGGGGGGAPEVASGRPQIPPQMQLPSELMPPEKEPVEPTVIDVVPGVGVAAAELPIAPITLPVVAAPAIGLGGGGGSGGAPAAPSLPGTPRGVTAEPRAGREPLPARLGSNAAVPASSYRIGYTEYLRSAGLLQVAALAAPGVAGMLVLTGAGGLVGYRQAKAGHAVHTSGIARFVN
jgi:hypothetical protein